MFLQKLKEKNDLYNSGGLEILGEYECSSCKILVKNKYGECLVRPNHLIQNKPPSILTAINKTEYFINQAREVHGDKYDYSEVEYGGVVNVNIICPIHGIFEQSRVSHLQGSGCSKCFYETNSETAKDRYIKLNKNNVCYNYLFEFKSENENFYKIGLTNNLENRLNYFNYTYDVCVIDFIEGSASNVWDVEKRISNSLCDLTYTPNKKFRGYTECYQLKQKVKDEFTNIQKFA